MRVPNFSESREHGANISLALNSLTVAFKGQLRLNKMALVFLSRMTAHKMPPRRTSSPQGFLAAWLTSNDTQ